MNGPKSLLSSLRRGPPLRRELLIAALCLTIGLLVVPLLVYVAGRSTLGDYRHGGPVALLRDYLEGLGRSELAFWMMLLGPYAFVQLVRAILRAAR